MGRVFQIALRGKGKTLLPQCSGMIHFAGGIFTRSYFGRSENCYLVRGGDKNLVGGVYWGRGGIFPGGGMSKFLASGGDSPISPVGKTLYPLIRKRTYTHQGVRNNSFSEYFCLR